MDVINLLQVYETQNFSCKYFVLRKMRQKKAKEGK